MEVNTVASMTAKMVANMASAPINDKPIASDVRMGVVVHYNASWPFTSTPHRP